MIIRNTTVRTMDPDQPVADSVTIAGDRIAAVGEVDGTTGDVVEGAGLCVVPGFTDSHTHFASWALALQQPHLEGARSAEEVVDRVAAAMPRPSGWIVAIGWSDRDWDDRVVPDRHQLDAAIPELPVALMSKDYHSLWVNSEALRRADGDLEQAGGVVERDADGRPTGILREAAAWHFRDSYVRPTHDEMIAACRPAIALANARGVTSIHDKDGWLDVMPVWSALHARGELSLRVWQSYPPDALDDLARLRTSGAPMRLGYIKVFMDGTVGSGTALMSDGTGVAITSEQGLVDVIRRAAEHGLAVGVHAIGDLANTRALNAFETTRDDWASRGLRPRIEHAQLLAPADVRRFAELGVAASVQFVHAPSDRDRADAFLAGRDVVAYGFRSLLDAGAVLVNGSDAPVEDLDPLRGIAAGVTRTLDGRPPWGAAERVSALDALRATTEHPAWLAHAEHERGRIRSGYLADLVVLDRDPVTADPRDLGQAQVVATMFDGRWVHNPPPW